MQNNIICNTDIYIRVKISEHEYFTREGDNIITTNYVTVSQYILGGIVKILSIHGIKEINITPYTDKIEINNCGVKKRGKHIVNVQIRLPIRINNEQRRIFNDLKKYEE